MDCEHSQPLRTKSSALLASGDSLELPDSRSSSTPWPWSRTTSCLRLVAITGSCARTAAKSSGSVSFPKAIKIGIVKWER
jgi:hypothetical protein